MRLEHYTTYFMEEAEASFTRFCETSATFWLDEALKRVHEAYGLVLYATAEGISIEYTTEELINIMSYLDMLRVTR